MWLGLNPKRKPQIRENEEAVQLVLRRAISFTTKEIIRDEGTKPSESGQRRKKQSTETLTTGSPQAIPDGKLLNLIRHQAYTYRHKGIEQRDGTICRKWIEKVQYADNVETQKEAKR